MADLKVEASGLPIDFLLGQSSEVIQTALSSSLVQVGGKGGGKGGG